MKWIAVAIYLISVCHIHFRGRVRLPVLRQLFDHSSFLAPINMFLHRLSAVPATPFLPLDRFRDLAMLEENFGDACSVLGTTGVLFHRGADLAEFLASPSTDVISSQHAFWLAALLWLGRHGWMLQMAPGEGGGVQGKLGRGDTMLTPAQLAAWMEQF